MSACYIFAQQVYKSLVEATRSIKGANVENNKFCVSVHYRNVDKKVGLGLKLRGSCLPCCNSLMLPCLSPGLEIGRGYCRQCPECFSSSQTNNRTKGRKTPKYCSLVPLAEYASYHVQLCRF
jgi:hypothetical protein